MRRLDAELVVRGLARSREEAQSLVDDRKVILNGFVALKYTSNVDRGSSIAIRNNDETKWASRAGYKLVSALGAFPDLQISNRVCLDAGASTGGFTDVLLSHGARIVFAVDVGYGQMIWRLQNDERVVVMDRINVRNLKLDDLLEQPDLITADLSFISLTTVLPSLNEIIHPKGDLILMVKPQFEVGKDLVGEGVVLDLELRKGAVLQVSDAAWVLGWGVAGYKQSDIHGPSGNKEVFLWLRKDANQLRPDNLTLETEDGLNE